MFDQEINKWIVIAVTLAIIIGLYRGNVKPVVVFVVGVFALMLFKIIDTQVFLNSFANKSLISIFILVILTNAVNDNFNLTYWFDRFFSSSKQPKGFLLRMTSGVALLSSFMNNTPIVSLMIPYVFKWSEDNKVSPSKLLIPLSYSASLGGMITVIGTSTNLVLQGFLEDSGIPLLGFWDFAPLGFLVTVVGTIFLSTVGYKLLPDRIDPVHKASENQLEYLVETYVSENSRFIGKSIKEAELRNLDGIYLAQIVRNGHLIAPVAPDEVIEANDRLFFAGETGKIVGFIKKDDGIKLPSKDKFLLGDQIDLMEAVVPANSNMAGQTVKQYKFREKFDAAIIGIHRNGEKIIGKIGDVVLKNGDLLLLTAGKRFQENIKRDKNIYVVNNLQTLEHDNPLGKRSFILLILLILGLLFFGFFDLFMSLMIILMVMMAFKLTTFTHIRMDGGNMVLFVILASALTLGKALISTGAADMIAHGMISVFEPFGYGSIILGLCLLTLVLTSFITNVAAVSVTFPIAYALVEELGVSGTPFYVAIAFAASASFLTPISYQTNLMVYGPGAYKFKDFLRIGVPLTLIYLVITIVYVTQVHEF